MNLPSRRAWFAFAPLLLLWAGCSGRKSAAQAPDATDPASRLASLHREAATDPGALIPAPQLANALIDAGFPPRLPVPSLSPRIRLASGGTADVLGAKVSRAHYEGPEGRFSVFLLPDRPELLPPDAAPLVRQGAWMRITHRGDVGIVFWRSGRWLSAAASEMPEATRDELIELAQRAQRL